MNIEELVLLRKGNLNTISRSIKGNAQLQAELFVCTQLLEEHYTEISQQQRIYHLLHKELVLCNFCDSVAAWTPYNKGYFAFCNKRECKNAHNKLRFQRQWDSMSDEKKEKRRLKWIESKKKSNLKNFGVEWHTQTEDFKKKCIETSLEHYGVEHHMQDPTVMAQREATTLEKYGKTHYMATDEFKGAFAEKYGVKHPMHVPEFKEKLRLTNQGKYGVDWYTQTDKFQSKSKETYLQERGVEHSSQIAEVLEKRHRKRFERKEFVLPSGSTVLLQGYEDKALKLLLESYTEDDICFTSAEIQAEIGKVMYIGKDGKVHRYFPDFYVKSTRTVVEVKSQWTFSVQKALNLLKESRCKEMGFNFEFMIF